MIQKNIDKRNYVIGALLLLVLFMTVGFAAFRTTLTINGTAAITSNWCVGFDNRNDEAYEITKGLSTGTQTVYNANKGVLQTAFTEENACNDGGSDFGCGASGVRATAYSNGNVNASDGSWSCSVISVGSARCCVNGGGI